MNFAKLKLNEDKKRGYYFQEIICDKPEVEEEGVYYFQIPGERSCSAVETVFNFHSGTIESFEEIHDDLDLFKKRLSQIRKMEFVASLKGAVICSISYEEAKFMISEGEWVDVEIPLLADSEDVAKWAPIKGASTNYKRRHPAFCGCSGRSQVTVGFVMGNENGEDIVAFELKRQANSSFRGCVDNDKLVDIQNTINSLFSLEIIPRDIFFTVDSDRLYVWFPDESGVRIDRDKFVLGEHRFDPKLSKLIKAFEKAGHLMFGEKNRYQMETFILKRSEV